MLRVNQLNMAPGRGEEKIREKLLQTFHLEPEELLEWHIFKRSIDARKKPEVFYSYTIDFSTKNERKLLQKYKGRLRPAARTDYQVPECQERFLPSRPIIVGAGPA